MSRRHGADHRGDAHRADRSRARGPSHAAQGHQGRHSASTLRSHRLGSSKGPRKAAQICRGAARTPRRHRSELKPSLESFDARSAMDALGDAIAVVAPDWRVRYVNGAWERTLGVPRQQTLDADFWTTYPSLASEPGASQIRATASDGLTRRFD